MSTLAEARGQAGGLFIQGDGTASSSSLSPSKSSSSSSSSASSHPRHSKPSSPMMISSHKKASPSDLIFGQPPGADSASQAFGSLYADSSSSSASTSTSTSIHSGPGSGNLRPAASILQQVEGQSSAGGSSSGKSTSSDGRQQATSSRPTTSSASARSQSATDGGVDIQQDAKILPALFEDADVDDVVELVADMLSRLMVHNDQLPLHPTSLTRFHSRATPSISVLSYIKRITKYTSLEKACTLILLVYIDRVCERIPGFTICSLTVHRFICAAVVCASKALCDSFSTNGHYAKVGGISLVELNMLEKEFLGIIDWKLSCSGHLLQYYYTSLVSANPNPKYTLELDPSISSSVLSTHDSHSREQHLSKDGGVDDGDVKMT